MARPAASLLIRTFLASVAGFASTGCESAKQEALLVIDQSGGPGQNGAIFRIDPLTRAVSMFATSKLWNQPQDILQEPDGDILVLDYYEEGGVGKIFEISRDGLRCEERTVPPGLVDPYQFQRAPDGSIWIVDKNADPHGSGENARKTGTLWRLSEDFESLTVLATGPPLAAPAAVFFVGEDAFLMDADAFQTVPLTAGQDEGAIFKVHPYPAELETVVRLKKLISPLGLHRLPSGDLLVIDVNADPVERLRYRGAVYRVSIETGETTLFANSDEFRAPVNCLPWQGALLVVDAHADPLDLGNDGVTDSKGYGGDGRGAVFAVDLQSGHTRLFVASPLFVNPVRLRTVHL